MSVEEQILRVENLSITQLRDEIHALGGSTTDCIEKNDLKAKLADYIIRGVPVLMESIKIDDNSNTADHDGNHRGAAPIQAEPIPVYRKTTRTMYYGTWQPPLGGPRRQAVYTDDSSDIFILTISFFVLLLVLIIAITVIAYPSPTDD